MAMQVHGLRLKEGALGGVVCTGFSHPKHFEFLMDLEGVLGVNAFTRGLQEVGAVGARVSDIGRNGVGVELGCRTRPQHAGDIGERGVEVDPCLLLFLIQHHG